MTPVVLVSGLSGAGKASILGALEDLGYEAVDNIPLNLVDSLVSRGERPLAIGLDVRTRDFDAAGVVASIDAMRTGGRRIDLVYAWAETSVLLRRYTETRRRHPLALDGRVVDGIEREAILTAPLREKADVVLDTSELPIAELRRAIGRRFGQPAGDETAMAVTLVSFGFPSGLPREADMVFDARFLRNPHYDMRLRPLTGLDAEVATYVERDPFFEPFFASVLGLVELVLPRFVQEGKKYATIAVGCTGGRHRSVRMTERLAAALRDPISRERTEVAGQGWTVNVVHRELTRGAGIGMDKPPRDIPSGAAFLKA